MLKLTPIFLILLFYSCSKITVIDSDVAEETIQVVAEDNNNETALEQKQEKTEEAVSQIVGSSEVDATDKHKGGLYYLYGAEHLKLENYYFDIPVVYNAAVKKWINYFLNKGRGFFQRYSARAGRYAPLLGTILEKHGLPRDLIFLAMAESGFQNHAKSWARAVGPWQFMPATGKRYGLTIDWYVDERRDPIKATISAAKYLKDLYERFGSWELAAAGYNAGEGKVNRAIRRYRTENFWKIRKGRYLKNETRNYVPKIMALAIIGKNLTSFGFEDINFHEPLDFDEVILPSGTDIISFADKSEIPFEEVQRLNPELLRWFTPFNKKTYILRVPVQSVPKVGTLIEDEDLRATAFQTYRIRGKTTSLKKVSQKFKIKKTDVMSVINNIPMNKVIKRGTTVLLPFREGQSRKENMYADLYERPRRSVLRKRKYRSILKMARKRGRAISNPTNFYTVKNGDSLWSVARKNRISLANLIMSNYLLVKNRMIRVGDKLAVR